MLFKLIVEWVHQNPAVNAQQFLFGAWPFSIKKNRKLVSSLIFNLIHKIHFGQPGSFTHSSLFHQNGASRNRLWLLPKSTREVKMAIFSTLTGRHLDCSKDKTLAIKSNLTSYIIMPRLTIRQMYQGRRCFLNLG